MAPRVWGGSSQDLVEVLSARQFWLAAYDVGVTREILFEHARSSFPAEEAGRMILEIEVATQFSRSYPLVDELADLVGLSSQELDALWRWASTI